MGGVNLKSNYLIFFEGCLKIIYVQKIKSIELTSGNENEK